MRGGYLEGRKLKEKKIERKKYWEERRKLWKEKILRKKDIKKGEHWE